MASFDIQKVVAEVVKDLSEVTIKRYREFYEINLEPINNRGTVRYKISTFLKGLEKQPESYFDHSFSTLIEDVRKFAESTFGNALQEWYEETVPEVLAIKKADSLYTFRLNELSWLQHKTKLQELRDRFDACGLHPDIEKRETTKYARYNVVIEHHPSGAKKHKKECKTLMPLADLEQQVLLPQRSQKPLQLNGKFFPTHEIKRFTITKTLLIDAEVRLYKAKHYCRTDLAFCNHFPEVTDKMIHNHHLEESINETQPPFVVQSRIEAFRAYTGITWDLAKLIQLCEELNDNFHAGNFYSLAYLSRALIDHVPPILGCKSFDEVANNYAGDKSFKKAMEHLNKTLKHIADLHIHKQVSAKLSIPTMMQVDFKQDLDLLLGELLAKI